MVKSWRRRVVAELIGQVKRTYRVVGSWWGDLYRTESARDWTTPDARFWDHARRGKAKGLELSGLFLKPLGSKVASWVLGQAPRWNAESAAGKEALNTWWGAHQAEIVRAYQEAVDLGNCFLVVNADLSVTVVPPSVVTPLVDEDDYSRIVGWRITERHPHPERSGDEMVIVDEYTATERVQRRLRNGAEMSEPQRFPNLIGRCPVVHIPNVRGANEVFGRPEGEALVDLLHWYQETLVSALEGNKHQGRPTPVVSFETLDQLDKFFAANGSTVRQTLDDGTVEETVVVDFDSDRLLALAGGDMKYEQPGSFANDTERLLGLLYYLFLEHVEIPEFVMGTAIASSKASAETQMPVFVKWIEKKRGECSGWLVELASVALAYLSLVERGVRADEAPTPGWAELTGEDGRLTQDAVQWAHAEGLLDEETALRLMPFEVEDPRAVLAQAKREREARQAETARATPDFGAQMQDEAGAMDADTALEDAA